MQIEDFLEGRIKQIIAGIKGTRYARSEMLIC
jgi:hypothetical protein